MGTRSEYNTNAALGALLGEIHGVDPKLALADFFHYMRFKFWQKALRGEERLRNTLRVADISVPDTCCVSPAVTRRFDEIINRKHLSWNNWGFHHQYRLHLNSSSLEADFDVLYALAPQYAERKKGLWRIIKEGVNIDENRDGNPEHLFYDLSMLPLNFLLGEAAIDHFIPPEDYFEAHDTKNPDPYGIIQGKTRSEGQQGKPAAVLINAPNDRKLIIGSQKFTHTLLFNIDFYCPIGCSDCYKTRMGTRDYIDPELRRQGISPHMYEIEGLGTLTPPDRSGIEMQAREAVRWMNTDPDRGMNVYDVIISGGEPLLLSDTVLKAILRQFEAAKNLKVLRICTGALFLGLPFRITEGLLDALSRFSDRTGVRVTIQAHLGSQHMITPESVLAVQKIRTHQFPIYSQIPIKEGVNFFVHDWKRTIGELADIGRKQLLVGVDPYMFIVDMHPSTNKYYVPIEPLMQVWGKLVESHDFPGLERPRTLSILFRGGNIILSGSTLFAAKKEVDHNKKKVTYRIPRVEGEQVGESWRARIREEFRYEEPLMVGVNDDPQSLDVLRQLWFGSSTK